MTNCNSLYRKRFPWYIVRNLYAETVRRALQGDPSVSLQTAEQAADVLLCLEGIEGEGVARARDMLRQLIENALKNAHHTATIPIIMNRKKSGEQLPILIDRPDLNS